MPELLTIKSRTSVYDWRTVDTIPALPKWTITKVTRKQITYEAVRIVVSVAHASLGVIVDQSTFEHCQKVINALMDMFRAVLRFQTIREIEGLRDGRVGDTITKGITTLSSHLSRFEIFTSRSYTVKGMIKEARKTVKALDYT
jgi:hypothetical protein